MVRPSAEFRQAARPYLPVRVTDLAGLDLRTYAFDYDLTLAILVLAPDGYVLHRYGGRDARSPTGSLSMGSLVRFLRGALESYRDYARRPRARERRPPMRIEDIPAWAEKMAERRRRGRPLDCVHCHFVYDAYWEQGRRDGTWDDRRIWRFPPPARIGLVLDREEQELVREVRAGSPAARAGLRPGDRLLRVGTQRILSHADLSWVLENTPYQGAELSLRFLRAQRERGATLRLEAGWRVGTPLEFSWRPSKWRLQPRPGFGGRDLRPEERAAFGLAADAFAFRITYLVTWGPMPRYGKAAVAAGIRKGDVVVGVDGAELEGHDHFHAWWRLTRRPGDTVVLRILRPRPGAEPERRTVRLRVLR
ncbi:MAG: PDZ domain-containing protein [Planctomycetota bacterium]|nr:MAG: PDZ domain-containing protein [Planctomycetota bacterium]